MYRLELTKTQVWLVARSLLLLTSDEGADAIHREYPDADLEALSEDIGALIGKLEALVGSDGKPVVSD